MGNETMVTVPYGDFVDGMKALADLDNIRVLIESGAVVVLNDIKPILGLEVKENARANRKSNAD